MVIQASSYLAILQLSLRSLGISTAVRELVPASVLSSTNALSFFVSMDTLDKLVSQT